MRNLKKILALVLALVMSFSLMATANAFTDDEKITDTYETAVTVLSGLKVFQGYDDGSFLPQGSITRAEVAAIIYRIVTGDVNDTQVGIYADYNKFDDVKSTSWYAGYVNFCANAEYIKGYDAKTFGPNDPVTGYQALAMILRALGYDKNGEFTGASWQVQTAAVGENRGITKNISAGTLGTAATREVVAEILFRAILVEKVNYTPAFGYQLDDTSIGWDTFELEEIEGVVVANEYADLYDTDTLKAGKTELNVDGESYVIDYTSTLEDIGEARYAYITEGKTVLALGDAGNTVFETGAETDIKTDSKFEKATGLERGDAEEFINFDGGNEYKASDWKIKYVVEFANGDATVAFENKYGVDIETVMDETAPGSNEFEKTIKAGNTITNDDLTIIKYIFNEADKDDNDFIKGEVYVGTQSTTDISDELSYNQFKDKYIETDENAIEVQENENGNWLKVIDNDGDGKADYVLKTIYTFAAVEELDRDDDLELTASELDLVAIDDGDAINDIDKDFDIVCADELSDGDIVYYAVIDGNAQTYLAEMVTATIKSVNRRTLTATTTDGDEYVESGVCNHVNRNEYEDGVGNLSGSTSYDLYLDKFGYLGVFTETATSGNFVLLVNGWYNETRAGDEYAAMVWDREAQELVDTDITDGGELFIYHDNWTENNSWYNLKEFAGINNTGDLETIVASLNEDGELIPVEDVFNKKTINIVSIDNDELLDDNDYHTGVAYDTSANADDAYDHEADNDVEIRALSSTVYYYVYNTGNAKDDFVVNEYVGYKNVPELSDDAIIEDVYAVGTLTDRESNNSQYYTANIVVVEFSAPYDADAEQVFVVDTPVVDDDVTIDDVTVIRADGTMATVDIDLEASNYYTYGTAAQHQYLAPGLYYMWETEDDGVYTISAMSHEDIAANDYTTGEVYTALGTYEADWVGIEAYVYDASGSLLDESTGVELEYQLTEDSKLYTLGYDDADRYGYRAADLSDETAKPMKVLDEIVLDVNDEEVNNRVMVAFNSKDEIVYAISFIYDDTGADNFVTTVWDDVKPAGEVALDDAAQITVTLGDLAATEQVLNATGDNETTTIAYADSDPTVHGLKFSVNEGTSEVILERQNGWDGTDYVYSAVIRSQDGSETIEVTYTVSVDPANTEAELQVVADTNGVITTDEEYIGVKGNVDVNASQIVSMFEATKEAPLATLTWEFVSNSDGKEYTEEDLDVIGSWDESQFSTITATVTAQDGTSKSYTFEDVASLTVDTSYAPDAWTFSAEPTDTTWYKAGESVNIVITCENGGAIYTANDRYVDYLGTGVLSDTDNKQIAVDGTVTVAVPSLTVDSSLTIDNVH